MGFSDLYLASHFGVSELEFRKFRLSKDVLVHMKMIDTVSGEYEAISNYLYCSYHSQAHDVVRKSKGRSILVLGSGAFSIGSSLEFDWCCTKTLRRCHELGYTSIFVNHNPETVSTDYDECDRLYFEEINLERILDIISFEEPYGVIVSMCGQVGNDLVQQLSEAGVMILGTPVEAIQICENRLAFSKHLDSLQIKQANWKEYDVRTQVIPECLKYPIVLRPSNVLSGTGMHLLKSREELQSYLISDTTMSGLLLSEFIDNALEIEFDGVGDSKTLVAYAISEHIEKAGIHSGDSCLLCPTQNIELEIEKQILCIAEKMIQSLKICGVFNIQFILKDNNLSVIECNLRASRSLPFVSKVLNRDLVSMSIDVMLNHEISNNINLIRSPLHVGVKVPQFSFHRLRGVDPTLGIQMKSTGEVACFGSSFEEAFLKAMMSVGYPDKLLKILIMVEDLDQLTALDLGVLQITILASKSTAQHLKRLKVSYQRADP
ncbi:ATP-grasp domain-containing protein, partial [bacterium]|nr:ATP-grasp domain-containing protein [bacterium]